MAAANRSKFAYVNFADIQTLLNDGKLDAYDMIFAQDRNEYCIISPELEIKEIRGRVYTYDSVAAANAAINTSMDTYAGMVLAIKSTEGKYEGYIVNESGNSFYVTAIKAGDIEINYDNINNTPIKNIIAKERIYLVDLPNGFYHVTGTYKVNSADPTTRIDSNPALVMVRHDGSKTYVKLISDDTAYDYISTATETGLSLDFDRYVKQSDLGELHSIFMTKPQVVAVSREVSREEMVESSANDEDINRLFNKDEDENNNNEEE